jgi:hypothetical protein
MQHLNKIRKQNPRLSLGEAMKLAKKSYHKGSKTRKSHRGGGEALSGFGAPTPEYPGGGTLADGQVGASPDALAKLAGNTYSPLGSMSGGADLSPADFNSAPAAPAGKETMLQKAGRKSRRGSRASRKSRKSRKGSRRH